MKIDPASALTLLAVIDQDLAVSIECWLEGRARIFEDLQTFQRLLRETASGAHD